MAAKQGLFDDIMDFGLRQPRRVGIALAFLAWITFHAIATQTAANSGNPTDGLGSIAQIVFIHVSAIFLQYAIAFCLLVGVLVSTILRRRAQRILANARDNPHKVIAALTWRDFERLAGEYFRQRGFAVSGVGSTGPDGGVDLVLAKDGKRYLVQCKHWKSWQVGVTVVRELNGVIAAQNAAGGYVITGGQFSDEARAFASACPIKLIDGSMFQELLHLTQEARVKEECLCPECGSSMLKKVAGQGRFKGQPFWSCSSYPKCRGKVHIENVA